MCLIKVEDGDGGELFRGTAGFGELAWLDEADKGLYDGVVSRVHVRAEWEGALSLAVECRVSVWRYYPALSCQTHYTL